MANSAISQTALGVNAVGTSNILDSAVTAAKIADDTITEAKLAAGATLQLATMSTTTGGTEIGFTGLPSGTKHITLMMKSISLSGTANIRVQLGPSGGYATSGYAGTNANTSGGASALSGGGIDFDFGVAAAVCGGTVELTLMDSATNLWSFLGIVGRDDATQATRIVNGTVALSGVADRVRVYTSNGTDTFDANGGVNIAYK